MASAGTKYTCYVGGLTSATTGETLRESFSTYGNIVDSKIVVDRETGRPRGFGFVTFDSEYSMQDAVAGMNGQILDGRNIKVSTVSQ